MFTQTHTRTVTVTRPEGLHARPCVAIATTVARFKSKVEIHAGRQKVEGNQVLQLLSLGARQGTEIKLTAKGPDAEEVLDALVGLFESDFGLHD